MAASRLASPPGPSVLGLVWSMPVVQCDQRGRPVQAGHPDQPQQRPGDDLIRKLLGCSARKLADDWQGHSSLLAYVGFSQITVPPMPMPMHIAVRP